MAILIRTIAVFLACLSLPAGAWADKRIALVIGNSNYTLPGLKLANPENDAADLSAALRRLSVHVTEGKDLTISAFDRAIDAFIQDAKDADVAIFFFAGHGLQIDKRGYLVPIDFKAESESAALRELVAVQEVISRIEKVAKVTIVMLDACRDSPLRERIRRVTSESRNIAQPKGLPPISIVGSNTLIVYSTVPGEAALDGTGERNSPFATALLRHIETPGLEIEQMFKRVTADVLNKTQGKQQPERLSRLQTELVFLAARQTAATTAEQAAAEEDAAFETAVRLNKAAGYEMYLTRYPNGRHGTAARTRLAASELESRNNAEAAAWEQARRINRLAEYEEFFKAWPSGQKAGEARQIIERLTELEKRWEALRAGRSLEQLRRLAADTQGTEFYVAIEAQVDALERDDKARWEAAEKTRAKTAYQAYLDDEMDGDFEGEAKARLAQIELAAKEWERIAGKSDEAALEAFLKRDNIADFESAALAELVALRRERNKPLPAGVSILTSEAMARLIDGKTIKFRGLSQSISFRRSPYTSKNLKLRPKYFQTEMKQKFPVEGSFAADVTVDNRKLSIGGIAGVQESRVDKTGSLLLLEILSSDRDERDLATKDRLYATMQVIKDNQGYICIGTQWSLVLGDKPAPFEERCEFE